MRLLNRIRQCVCKCCVSVFKLYLPSCKCWSLCVSSSDVNSMYLSSTEPPAAAEWACLLRPLRGREPEGIWNLLSIVREMFKRRDSNAAPLLEILTEQCLTYEQVCNKYSLSHSIFQRWSKILALLAILLLVVL